MPQSNFEKLLRGAVEKHGLSELVVRTSRFDLDTNTSEMFQAIGRHWNATLPWGVGVEADPVEAAVAALTKFPKVSKDKRLSGTHPTLPKMVVDGLDRREIRAALSLLQDGKTKEGTDLLRKVTLGWVVPDKVPETKKSKSEPVEADEFDGMLD